MLFKWKFIIVRTDLIFSELIIIKAQLLFYVVLFFWHAGNDANLFDHVFGI